MNCGCGARAIRIDGRYVCSSCRRDPVSCLCPATPVKADMRNDFRMARDRGSPVPYPDLWKRARRFMDEKYPDEHGIPSREMLIHLLLKEAGF